LAFPYLFNIATNPGHLLHEEYGRRATLKIWFLGDAQYQNAVRDRMYAIINNGFDNPMYKDEFRRAVHGLWNYGNESDKGYVRQHIYAMATDTKHPLYDYNHLKDIYSKNNPSDKKFVCGYIKGIVDNPRHPLYENHYIILDFFTKSKGSDDQEIVRERMRTLAGTPGPGQKNLIDLLLYRDGNLDDKYIAKKLNDTFFPGTPLGEDRDSNW
jgi:hypothetical protein